MQGKNKRMHLNLEFIGSCCGNMKNLFCFWSSSRNLCSTLHCISNSRKVLEKPLGVQILVTRMRIALKCITWRKRHLELHWSQSLKMCREEKENLRNNDFSSREHESRQVEIGEKVNISVSQSFLFNRPLIWLCLL